MQTHTWNEGQLWGVMNEDLRIRVGLLPDTGHLWIGVDARVWDNRPTMADYSHDDHNTYAPDEITVTDDGCLTAMHRQRTAQAVDFRTGFTLRLPLAFVAPIRIALTELTRALGEPLICQSHQQGVRR
jgi:hypothetical protein